jgi:hypothetical protein
MGETEVGMERTRWAIAGGVLAVLLLVVGALVLRREDGETATGVPLPAPVGRSDGDPFAAADGGPVPAPPGSPAEVATRFLDAEVAGDLDTSFAHLAAEDREEQRDPAGWLETHADLWAPTAHRLTGVAEEGDGTATATADVTFRPQIDEFTGLVPARARLTLPLVQEEGAWRVAFNRSGYEPEYPDEGGAVEAVQAWAEARTRCSTEAQWDGGLLDSPYLADALCGAEGGLRLGAPDTLDALDDAGPYLADFGDLAADWARVVPIDAPSALDAVAAPLGERWVVIGTSPRAAATR